MIRVASYQATPITPSAQRRCVGQPLSNRGMDAEEAAPRNGFRVGGDL